MVQVRLVLVGDGVRNGSEGAERAGSDQTWSLADPDQRDEFHDAAGRSGGADCDAAGGAAGDDPVEDGRRHTDSRYDPVVRCGANKPECVDERGATKEHEVYVHEPGADGGRRIVRHKLRESARYGVGACGVSYDGQRACEWLDSPDGGRYFVEWWLDAHDDRQYGDAEVYGHGLRDGEAGYWGSREVESWLDGVRRRSGLRGVPGALLLCMMDYAQSSEPSPTHEIHATISVTHFCGVQGGRGLFRRIGSGARGAAGLECNADPDCCGPDRGGAEAVSRGDRFAREGRCADADYAAMDSGESSADGAGERHYGRGVYGQWADAAMAAG